MSKHNGNLKSEPEILYPAKLTFHIKATDKLFKPHQELRNYRSYEPFLGTHLLWPDAEGHRHWWHWASQLLELQEEKQPDAELKQIRNIWTQIWSNWNLIKPLDPTTKSQDVKTVAHVKWHHSDANQANLNYRKLWRDFHKAWFCHQINCKREKN